MFHIFRFCYVYILSRLLNCRAQAFYIIYPVYFCQFIFSTATDGKIKAWLYDNIGSRVDYDAPGHSSTAMTYSADGSRFLHPVHFTYFQY